MVFQRCESIRQFARRYFSLPKRILNPDTRIRVHTRLYQFQRIVPAQFPMKYLIFLFFHTTVHCHMDSKLELKK